MGYRSDSIAISRDMGPLSRLFRTLKSLEKKGKTLKEPRHSSKGKKKQGNPKKQGEEEQGLAGMLQEFFGPATRRPNSFGKCAEHSLGVQSSAFLFVN